MLDDKEVWINSENLQNTEEKIRLGMVNADPNNDFGSYKLLKEGRESNVESHVVTGEMAVYFADLIKYLVELHSMPHKSIAEMGSGPGFTAAEIKNRFPDSDVSIYEVSGDAIDYAKRHFPKLRAYQMAIDPKLKFNEKFDIIVAREFYPFTRTGSFDFQNSYIKHFLESLHPNGYLIINMLKKESSLLANLSELYKQYPHAKISIEPANKIYKKVKSFAIARLLTSMIATAFNKKFRHVVLIKKI